jgi:hypothetical protein
MSYYWIESAMAMGGKLGMQRVTNLPTLTGRELPFVARMQWRGQGYVQGDAAAAFDGALLNLDRALQEDAAKEMIEKGAV